MGQIILIIKYFFFLFFFLVFFNGSEIGKIINGKAIIIDGDTIHIGNNKIRLHGIDAPELYQTCNYKGDKWNCGQQSKNFLKKIISLNPINCKVNDIDRYKRYIAICYSGKYNINEMMVKNGWAIAYRYYSKDYIEDELIAEKEKLGIWKGSFEEPYKFRKKNK
tara:strand:+ start:1662 stop:2153 length:492 start_codon:yes stop_codon:yes gene_type:complete